MKYVRILKHLLRPLLHSAVVAFLAFIVGVTIHAVLAQVAPPKPPGCPLSACNPPLHTGSQAQTKSGGLNILGNVGIGTESPQVQLDIARDGTGQFDAGILRLTDSGNGNLWQISNRGSEDTGNRNKLAFWYWNGSNWTSPMYMTPSGSVGIGTSSPHNDIGWRGALEVNGQVKAAKYYDDAAGYYADLNSGANLGGHWKFNKEVQAMAYRDDDSGYYADLNTGANLGGDWKFNDRVCLGSDCRSAWPVTTEEDLRIVRGTISSLGAPITGGGFTSKRHSQGAYTITLNKCFSRGSYPAIVATPRELEVEISAQTETPSSWWETCDFTVIIKKMTCPSGWCSYNFVDSDFNFIIIGIMGADYPYSS